MMEMTTVEIIQMSLIIVRCVIRLKNLCVKMVLVFCNLMYAMVKMIVVITLMKTCIQKNVVSILFIKNSIIYFVDSECCKRKSKLFYYDRLKIIKKHDRNWKLRPTKYFVTTVMNIL